MDGNEKSIKFIYNNSEDEELFDENQEDRIFNVHRKASALQRKLNENKNFTIEIAKRETNKEIELLSHEWPSLFGQYSKEIYVHVDLDSFYASVETLINPAYKDIPLGVGGMMMLAATNYKAREYNIKAGMPGYQAKALCPNLVITKCQFNQYNYYSEIIMSLLSQYDTEIEIYGLDEACLVFNEEKLESAVLVYNTNQKYGKTHDQPEFFYTEFSFKSVNEFIQLLRKTVYRVSGLTISAGISVCRGMAKFSSNINKPDGQFMIENDFDSNILPLDVNKINGIGKMTKELLYKSLSISTIDELRKNLYKCFLVFPKKTFQKLLRLSFGLSHFDSKRKSSFFSLSSVNKTIGNGWTFRATTDYKDICYHIWYLTESVFCRMQNQKLFAKVVTITIKYKDFKNLTKQQKVPSLIKTHEQLFDLSMDLLKDDFAEDGRTGFKKMIKEIRLLGVRVSSLIKQNTQEFFKKFTKPRNFLKNTKNCIICNKEFIYKNTHMYEAHVNKCLLSLEKKEKRSKETIIGLFNHIKNNKKKK